MKPTTQVQLDAENIVAFLGDIFTRRGGEAYLGESVTMAEHMLQAAFLAEQRGESETIIVAALLHDIGHFTGEFGAFSMNDTRDRYHEQAGARILEHFFPRAIAGCVGMHVAAKRYLVRGRSGILWQIVARVGAFAAAPGWSDERRRGGRVRSKSVPPRCACGSTSG